MMLLPTTLLLVWAVGVSQALPISLVSSNTALKVVQNMASVVAAPPKSNGYTIRKINGDEYNVNVVNGETPPKANGKQQQMQEPQQPQDQNQKKEKKKKKKKQVFEDSTVLKSDDEEDEDGNEAKQKSLAMATIASMDESPKEQVWTALSRLESNMNLLDELAGQKQQLNALEFSILAGCIAAAASAPIFGSTLTEFVAPSAAACCAAVGIGAEYVGKTAVADGKEVAALSIQCAAEAEAVLAQAERSKAISPLCVGIGAVAATCSLLIPAILEASGLIYSSPGVRELYLLCPVASILSAAIAGLATQETKQFCQAAIGVGNRRFARSGSVGRTWLSAAQQVARKSETGRSKLTTFTWSVIPAPLLGILVPGSLATKTIVISAFAAAESAYFLAQAEYILARATDAVALKTRSAAVCDTYANQGSRSAAILPFTSALSALCAATTAAIVELPFFEASTSIITVASQVVGISVFPTLAALFAGAASVSKARCEVDAEAAMQAASTLSLEYDEGDNSPVLEPGAAVSELIQLTLSNSVLSPLRKLMRRISLVLRFPRRWFFRSSLRRAFKLFDSDRDGLLSASELRRCVNKLGVQISDEDVVDMVKEYDKDGDGKINYSEFSKMMISA